MNSDKFNFEWTPIQEHAPTSGARYLITDGDVIIIGTYILEHDGNNIWIFNGMTEEESKHFNVLAWMTLPKPPTKENENY